MRDKSDCYQFRVGWAEEDEEYVGQCLEFPSLSWLAPTHEEAFSGIRQLVHEVVEDMRDSNEEVPEPLATRQYSGKFQVRVPADLHRQLVMRASENGVSLNLYVTSRLAVDWTPLCEMTSLSTEVPGSRYAK